MAPRKSSGKQHQDTGPAKAAPAGDPESRLLDAVLTLAARQGWRHSGLAEIAAEAGLPLHEAYKLHRSKSSILAALIRRVDVQVLAGADSGEGETARERLFDTLMRRFDALAPHKAAIRAILREQIGRPTALLKVPPMLRSMVWMLEASGIATTGCRGRAVVPMTLGLYLAVLRVFLADESSDLAPTMAALDRGLKRGEALCGMLPRRRRPEEAAPAAA